MSQRIFGLVLLLISIGLGIVAWTYHAPFSYEPVGPRAYPLLLLTLTGLGAIYLLIKGGEIDHGEEGPLTSHVLLKIGLCVLIMVLYAAFFETLGFVISSALFGVAMSRLYGGRWVASVIAGVLLSIGLYLLFDKILDVPLPLGLLSALEN
ncbi:tripartite tricarboxylate transporter TctB family protein [Ectopseudomonas mendocina]|uniref:Tripartite tricarboxylate transporter TctB family protein n=1 Tax=Ectopseudomonas mendocina TaxID=300 RepID=A0ABZ2RES7_ECTME